MNLLELHPDYLTALAGHFGFLGAFLGGVAATFFVTLLTLGQPSTVERAALALGAVAALAFIVTASMSVDVVATSHPNAPAGVASKANPFPQVAMALSFFVGITTLLAAIGVSGWSRSRKLGILTTGAALIAAIPVAYAAF